MPLVDRIFTLTIMGSILAFSIIHLGVSIGIIVPYRKYGNIFRPQVGLSGFNIVISIIGLATGILGIVSTTLKSDLLGRIVCIISGVLGLFAIASLISALVINAKSPAYVSSRFSSYLIAYQNNANARSIIDRVQYKYRCCGTDLWIDWARGGLDATLPSAGGTSTITISVPTTTAAPTSASGGSNTPPQTTTAAVGKRDIHPISNDLSARAAVQFNDHSRRKRQTTSTYGGIAGLPTDFRVVFPRSCCTSAATLPSNSSDAYCVSADNGIINPFYTAGCAKTLDMTAGNQAMGFGVINSIMLVLALVAIPALSGNPPDIV